MWWRWLLVAAIPFVAACKGPMARIEGLRDALVADDAARVKAATEGIPPCAELPPVALAPGQPSPRDKGCLADIASALGSKTGFHPSPPDQAGDATVAVVIAREGRGDFIAHADIWLGSMKNGVGPGPDALRLAVARRMAEAAPLVGRRIETEEAALATMKAIASSIPGACPTYFMLGTGVDPKTIPAELSSEHSACIHKDLSRRESVGPSYGEGSFRALEGSLGLWREAERALRLGLKHAASSPRATLDKKLAIIEDATKKNDTKKIADTTSHKTVEILGDVHADAGIVLWKDAGAEAGPPTPPALRKPLP